MGYEYFTSTDFEETTQKAKDMGWKDRQVQVRVEFQEQTAHYYIEPFERDCSCPNILNYKKIFGDY